ncbi:hypothetical protein H4N58_13230 [Mumia sp. ZJ1417]|uniref:hypothetical protein n=1 Tax=Mumia sp. ZJ1417 TaxID=2708082 RepID=UPI0015F81CDC|nr:hypothetical protein [Mumia sp. ZJ1417]QMW65171.1 hypothetical protein H4N58_13230 [Mumia sp. ZJ1417]
MTAYVIVIAAAAVGLVGWAFARTTTVRVVTGAGLAVALALAVVATIFEDPVTGSRHDVMVLFALVLAVSGGAVVTTAAFEVIDSARPAVGEGATVKAAADVLRGGAWIGALERLAVFGALAARWPEGVAIVLAVKGLGRYPELRAQETGGTPHSGAAERFIIGTMVSVIWAVACVYVAFAPYVVGVR